MLEVKNVSRFFGGLAALTDISFSVNKGEILGLIGPNGAGKTTLFNALSGLRAKTANYPGVTVTRRVGTVRLGDRKVALEDLPGTYSLEPVSPDEQVVSDLLEGKNPDAPPPEESAE